MVNIKREYMKDKHVKKAYKVLFRWFDKLQKKKQQGKPGLPNTLNAFLELAQKPNSTYSNIKETYFGLLRLKSWRKIVFETDQSKGAFYFLKLVRDLVGDSLEWPIGAWKQINYDYDPVAAQQEVDPAATTGDDDTGDGTSPQKGDTIPD